MKNISFMFDWSDEIWDGYTVEEQICITMWFHLDEVPDNKYVGFNTYITKKYIIDWDAMIDPWDDIYENCEHKYIPDEYCDLDDYYANPDSPKMTPNTKKQEFCSLKCNTDDYSCNHLECPRELEG